MRRTSIVLLLAAMLVASCTDDEAAVVETAAATSGEVVQTVAAPARIEPAARATVTATLGGRVAELLVEDGDVVGAGDPLLRLVSDSLEEQVEQAEAAVTATQDAAAAARDADVDLGPTLGALQSQVDEVFPPLLDALELQATASESALEAAIDAVGEATAAAEAADGFQQELLDAVDGGDLLDAAEAIDPAQLPDTPDSAEALARLEEARRTAADARARLATTRRAVDDTSAQLSSAESDLAQQTQAAGDARAAAAEAQIEQAERALAAVEERQDELEVTAPIGGVVELVRGGSSDAPPPLGGDLDIDALEGLGGLDAGDLGGDGGGTDVTGPVAVGRSVSPGQPLVRIFDVSSFHADVEVDELDVVEVEVGQSVVLDVDAYPDVELSGRVEHVALSPTAGTAGGALYPVTVELAEVPDQVRLRTGLTAAAEIEVRRVDSDLVVPTSALLRRGGGEVVYVVRDGATHETAVTVAAIGDQDAAIEGPLEPGDEVVTVGVELVEDGADLP